MPEDKRPRPTIELPGEPFRASAPRIPPPGTGGPASGSQSPRAGNSAPGKAGRAARTFGYLLAAILGGATVAGAGYVALTRDIPGFSLTDPQTRHRMKEIEDREILLEGRFRSLSAASAQGSYQSGTNGPEGNNETRSRLDTMVDTIRGLDNAIQSLSQKVQALEEHGGSGSANDVQAEIATQLAPLAHRLAATERDLEALTRVQNERQSDARTAALTLALTNLKRAISDGRPFPAELAAVETLAGNKLPVSQLSPYKDEGVASLSELQNEFADASKKTIEKANGGKPGNFMGEVLSRAKSAIQVRPSDGAGNSAEAILGRMSTALRSGDFKAALTQGAALDDPPQEMRDWFGRAQARVAADETLRKTDQELLASLTKATARRP